MKPSKVGQIVKFHTPLPDENPHYCYSVLAIAFDLEKPRADIQVINPSSRFNPINTVLVEDLELAN